jgi:hypothetical protein
MNDKIRLLQEQIEVEKRKISNCNHNFGMSYYNHETVSEGYGSVQDGVGSDPHWSFAGYRDVKKDRWSRKCLNCGFEQHTNKQEPIISGYKPSF